MIIDSHLHIFPDKLAAKTLKKLSAIGGMPYFGTATVDGTYEQMSKLEIDRSIAMNIVANPKSQTTINNWAKEVQSDKLWCFGSVHPDAPNAVEEVGRIKTLGLKGVKFHPDHQDFFVNDERMFPIYDAICQLNLPVLIHAGYDPISPIVHGFAEGIADVLNNFPQMRLIAAHMSGFLRYDEGEEFLVGKNLYLDTAMSVIYLPPERFKQILSKHGADKILFGSDSPWSDTAEEKKYIEELDISDGDKEKILGLNAMEFYGIK